MKKTTDPMLERAAYKRSLKVLKETRECHEAEVKRFKNKTSEWPAYHIQEALEQFEKKGYERGVRESAEKVRMMYGGRAHTFASENSEVYRTQDNTIGVAVNVILSLLKREGKKRGKSDV